MGKKYDNAKKIIDSKKNYSIIEAVKLLQEVSFTRFDASIDLAIKMNLDTTRAEQQFRGSISLPHYFGKNIKMLVIDDTLTNEKAKALNVEYFGGAEKIAEIKDG
jgi:large subunit ribosomal protein L1